MKLKVLDRFLLTLGAAFAAAAGVGLVLLGLQSGGISLSGLWVGTRVEAWVLVAAGAILFSFAAYALGMPFKYRKHKSGFVVQQTGSGELRISVKAMESLVQRVLSEHKEATMRKLEIINQRDGMIVDLSVSLANNISIPLVVTTLQKQIKHHLLSASGVDAKQVRISVETAEVAVDGSPYALPPMPAVSWADEAGAPAAYDSVPADSNPEMIPDSPKLESDYHNAGKDQQDENA